MCSSDLELPAPELTEEEIKRQEFLKKERIRSRERYQKLKSGERTVGVPVTLTCKCCGQEFASKRTNTLFCGPNCRAKFYRQEAAEGRSRACTCENCGKEFITTRSDVKYCSDDCRYAAQIKRQGARKKALRECYRYCISDDRDGHHLHDCMKDVADGRHRNAEEIGRASCRERV